MQRRQWLGRIAAVTVIMCGLLLFSVWRNRKSLRDDAAAGANSAASSIKIPKSGRPSVLRTAPQFVVLFIGSSTCGASTRPELPEALQRIRAGLANEAEAQGATISFVGVATDWSLPAGLKFLSPFGPFNQVIVGDGWLNTATVTYVWRDLPGAAALPQIVVLRRDVTVRPEAVTISEDKLLIRKTGVDDLVNWSKSPIHL
jgi:hypothetical protein